MQMYCTFMSLHQIITVNIKQILLKIRFSASASLFYSLHNFTGLTQNFTSVTDEYLVSLLWLRYWLVIQLTDIVWCYSGGFSYTLPTTLGLYNGVAPPPTRTNGRRIQSCHKCNISLKTRPYHDALKHLDRWVI